MTNLSAVREARKDFKAAKTKKNVDWLNKIATAL
jgi:hypothetical protein